MIAAASEPACGSVRQNAVSISPSAIGLRKRAFCSDEPYCSTAPQHSELTERIVEEAIAAGVRHLWMQPGAESAAAIERARAAGLNVIAGGPCLLVALGYRESGQE